MAVTKTNKRKSGRTTQDDNLSRGFLLDLFLYVDKEKFLSAKGVKDLPRVFCLRAKRRQCGQIVVDWEVVREALYESLRSLRSAPADMVSTLPPDDENFRPIDWALLHVWQFLPEVLDAALRRLCEEGLLKYVQRQAAEVPGMRIPPLTEYAKRILEPEERGIKRRLGSKDGRNRFFINKTHYENTLDEAKKRVLASGHVVTQETVAEKHAQMRGDLSNCDSRMIRQWNKDFEVDWKFFSREAANRRKLD